ncbi:hypothetical protein TNCV_2944251 [Trichonephila clavipes]|nr:hypothetical protein TNCV_2944251 [Trichonephila clavipes]
MPIPLGYRPLSPRETITEYPGVALAQALYLILESLSSSVLEFVLSTLQDKRLSQPCPARGLNPKSVAWKRDTLSLGHWASKISIIYKNITNICASENPFT